MLRRFRQWLADSEIQALARDIEKQSDTIQTAAHRLEGLQLRLERLANRVNMRMTRAGLPRERSDEDILDELRAARGNGGVLENPFDD